jgi:HSP20 family molecular chaperone IbpA
MKLSGKDVLLVGPNLHSAGALTDRLHRWGFRCHVAPDLRAACDLLSTHPVDLVLSNTHLPDGTGFRLLGALAGLPVAVFLCLPVENSCYWLPAIDGGKDCLGLPALRPSEFARGLEEMVRNAAGVERRLDWKLERTFASGKKKRRDFRGESAEIGGWSRAEILLHSKERKEKTMENPSSPAPSIKASTDLNLVSIHELSEHTQDVFHLIARRAYEIFESRGHGHGNDRTDWHLAESELLTPVKIHLSESGDQLIARAEVPGFNREEIKVSVEPRRLSISGKAETGENHKSGKHSHSHRHAQLMFRVIDLPTEVDLTKAKAFLRDGTLEVVLPKAAPAKSVRVETKPGWPEEGDTAVRETGRAAAAVGTPVGTGGKKPAVKAQPEWPRR